MGSEDTMQTGRARAWWRRRSLKGKAGIVVATVLVLFTAIGAFSEPPPEEPDVGSAVRQAAAGSSAAKDSDSQSAQESDAEEETTEPSASVTTEAGTTTPPPAKPKPKTTFKVARVVDGDTIKLSNGKSVRLVQIDAPETGEGECYSAKATALLSQLLPSGRAVRLEFDPKLDTVDQYGRQLAYVFKGRELVQHTLVVRGAASPWFYEGDRGRYAARLLSAAEDAKASGRGLWAACPGTALDPTRAITSKAPPPPPPPPPPPSPAATPGTSTPCHASYEGECLDPDISDYDCAGGSGNGPGYVQGTVRVVGPDEYRLDSDGDGYGCE